MQKINQNKPQTEWNNCALRTYFNEDRPHVFLVWINKYAGNCKFTLINEDDIEQEV